MASSIYDYFRLCIYLYVHGTHFSFSPISAGILKNVTNESDLACPKSDKNAIGFSGLDLKGNHSFDTKNLMERRKVFSDVVLFE